MAKCCAALLRLLRRRRGRGRAPEADAPLVGPSPAPADASAPEEEVLAPPVRALTKVQEEFEAAMKLGGSQPSGSLAFGPFLVFSGSFRISPTTSESLLAGIGSENGQPRKAANQEMHQRVKYYKDLNGGGNLTKHQEIDVRSSAAFSATPTGLTMFLT